MNTDVEYQIHRCNSCRFKDDIEYFHNNEYGTIECPICSSINIEFIKTEYTKDSEENSDGK